LAAGLFERRSVIWDRGFRAYNAPNVLQPTQVEWLSTAERQPIDLVGEALTRAQSFLLEVAT
jgi:hypothetical protein